MLKEMYFVSGMPRAGSTLLMNILAQNPAFYATGTSGLLNVLMLVRNGWENQSEHQAMDQLLGDIRRVNTLKSIIDGYYMDVNEPIVFDKSRGWIAHIEMLEHLFQTKVKILVPVRDLREILASFELLWRRNNAYRPTPQDKQYARMQSVGGRCQVWMQDDQPVGMAYNRVHDVILRGYRDRLHFVEYDQLTSDPELTLAEIYLFLGKEGFEHTFDHVEQVIHERDRAHGFDGLHTIRPQVTPQMPKRGILGKVANRYRGPYPWTVTP